MRVRDFLPFQQANPSKKKVAQVIDGPEQKAVKRLFKVASLALGFQSGIPIGYRTIFEYAPYDFTRIIQAVDTDSYVKQAFNKYKELIWKEGWDIVSDNPEAVAYLKQRIYFMELSMGRPFNDLLIEAADQLVKFHNSFLIKARGDLGKFFPHPLTPQTGQQPIVGYYVIPAETMQILRDRNNNVLQFRQNIWGANAISGAAYGNPSVVNYFPTFNPPDVIHMLVDRKPGRAFGTPFMTAVMDDVLALRQIEEDLQNLVHRELFPLYKYKVGTEERPAEPEEIEAAAADLANLRTEGGLVMPDRHDVEVIGADGKALEVSSYLDHFKERVAVGLGLSQHHLGMTKSGSNQGTTDRLDVALYDKIKSYQRYIASMVEIFIFNEILLEGGFDPHISTEGMSDRCSFVFREIDVDTQIKKENHIIQKYVSDLITNPEARMGLSVKPLDDDQFDELYTAISNRMLPAPGQPVKPAGSGGQLPPPKGTQAKGSTPLAPTANNPTGGKSASRGKLNPMVSGPNPKDPKATIGNPAIDKPRSANGNVNRARKSTGNRSAPQNQHGRRLSPNVRHSDNVSFNEKWLNDLVELLDEQEP